MQCAPKGPFLLPFKGKGEHGDWRTKTLRRRLEDLQIMCDEIDRDMHTLTQHFKQTFHTALPAYLTLHNTGNGKYVRWRMTGRQQCYFTLCQNKTGEQFLQPLSPPVREVIIGFEQQRLRLNLLYGLSHYEAKTVERFLREQKMLETLRRGKRIDEQLLQRRY